MRPSIRRRILILTTTTVAIVVAAVGLVVARQTERLLRSEFDETLCASAVATASRLEDDDGQVGFEMELAAQATAPIWEETALVIVDQSARVVYSTENPDDTEHALEAPRSALQLNTPHWFDIRLTNQRTDTRFVQMTVQLQPGTDPDDPVQDLTAPLNATVYLGRSTAGLESTLARLRSTLEGVLIASALAALIGGYIVSTIGARQVHTVAKRIAAVRPEHPKLEVDERTLPVELLPMIQTTRALLVRIDEELTRQRRLTADVAHDLRTPLAGVRTLLDVCLRQDRSSPEYVETISQALAALRQTSLMLDNVLTLSRLDADAEQPRFQCVEIAEILRGAVETITPLAAQRGVTVMYAPDAKHDAEFARIETDPTFLMKILVNLLSNAVEHSPAGGTVRIARGTASDPIELRIEDQGTGVPPELRKRIFERFFRADEARAAANGHSGLGLPIARSLARRLGGDVRLDPSSITGTIFTVTLPRGE